MNEKGLTKKEKELLAEFKQEITRQLSGQVLAVKLFGSKARGNAKKHSDIDVMVVLKEVTEKKKDIIYDVVVDLGLKYDNYGLSLVIYSKKDFDYFKKIKPLFLRTILKEAVVV